jgi:hypothetical protein
VWHYFQTRIEEEMITQIKAVKVSGFLVIVLTTIMVAQGCALFVVGGAAAGGTYGTVKYVDNNLRVTHDVTLDRAWGAGNAALKELQMPVTASNKDGSSGVLEARNAQNQTVTIKTIRKTDSVTEIDIRVGTFDTAENRAEAQQIYDKMQARF